MDQVIAMLSQYPMVMLVLSCLGSLVVLGQTIVYLTPTKKDDEILDNIEKGMFGKILDALKAFAVIQKK